MLVLIIIIVMMMMIGKDESFVCFFVCQIAFFFRFFDAYAFLVMKVDFVMVFIIIILLLGHFYVHNQLCCSSVFFSKVIHLFFWCRRLSKNPLAHNIHACSQPASQPGIQCSLTKGGNLMMLRQFEHTLFGFLLYWFMFMSIVFSKKR